jgi:hypothetical protein
VNVLPWTVLLVTLGSLACGCQSHQPEPPNSVAEAFTEKVAILATIHNQDLPRATQCLKDEEIVCWWLSSHGSARISVSAAKAKAAEAALRSEFKPTEISWWNHS